MRPLRDLIARAVPPREIGPVEPVALLSAVVRDAPEFNPEATYDRALFGLGADEVLALGPVLPHVCEVAYEALERSGLGFDRLRTLRVCTFLGVSDPQWVTVRDAPFLAELFGLPGAAHTVLESGAGLLLAVHHAVTAIRAGDTDVALVAGDHLEGVGAAVLAGVEHLGAAGRVRALVLGSASNRTNEEVSARSIAAARAGVDDKAMTQMPSSGLAGIADAIDAIERGETGVLTAIEVGEASTVQIVLGVAEESPPAHTPPRILGLSARTRPALRELVRATLARVRTEADLYGVANDALARPALEHRVATPLWGLDEVRDRLEAYLRGEPGKIASGYAVEAPVAFVVPPAGAQYAGMGDVWYGNEPVFREALNRCDRALRAVLPRPLLSVMFPAKGREVPVDDPVFANPLTFAFAYALAEVYRSRGLVPDAILGCGTGELAAAAIAGAVDVEEAIRVSAERGRLLEGLTAEAGRAVLGASESEVRELFAGDPEVDIVALPVPDRVVIGGAIKSVTAVVERARARGIRSEPMTGHPNNTPLVEPILAEFAAAAASLQFQTPEIGWVSATTGRRTEHADAAHWAATLRSPMRFSHGVETLYSLGCRSFVELAPRPTLLPAGRRTLVEQPSWWFAALDPDGGEDDRRHHEEVLAALWVVGASSVDRGPSGRFPGAAELPTYRWDRRPLDEEEETRVVAELSRVGETDDAVDWESDFSEEPDESPTLLPVVPGAHGGGHAHDDRERIERATEEEPRDLLELPPDPPIQAADTLVRAGSSPVPDAPEPAPPAAVPVPVPEPVQAELDVEIRVAAPMSSAADGSGGVGISHPSDRAVAESVLPPLPTVPPSGAPSLAPSGATSTAGPLSPSVSLPEPGAGAVDPIDDLDVTYDDLPLDGARPGEAAAEPEVDPTAGFLDELEDIDVDAYDNRAPRTLAEAEQQADAEVLWHERWVLDELPDAAVSDPTTWVILADGGGVGDYVATLLEGTGHRILRVLNETPYPREDRTMFVPDPTAPGAWEPVVESLGTLHGALRILHLWALDPSDDVLSDDDASGVAVDPRTGWAGILALVRELRGQSVPARLHLVTRGAVLGPARDGSGPPRLPDPAAAATGGALWGLAGALAVEAPYLHGGIVDLDPDDEDPDTLLKHLLGGGTDARPVLASALRTRPEHAFRGGQRWRRTIERVPSLPAPTPVDVDGAWVIGGDVDAMALELAQWLVGQGVKRVYLVSSEAPGAEVLRGVLDIQRKGVSCIVVRADPSESRDVVQIKARMSREAKVSGVVVRIAAKPAPLVDIALDPSIAAWNRAIAMADVLAQLARQAPRWVWGEGRSLDGVAGGGVAAIAGAAVAARVLAEGDAATRTVIHSGPSTDLSAGQAVRLIGRIGPLGGLYGIWRER